MKGERGAIALFSGFQVLEEPPNVSEEQITDLRLLVERGSILANGFFTSQRL
jgi:hypothetical protein